MPLGWDSTGGPVTLRCDSAIKMALVGPQGEHALVRKAEGSNLSWNGYMQGRGCGVTLRYHMEQEAVQHDAGS